MLTIHQLSCSAADAKRYYATADYYSQGRETVGRWGGKLAKDDLGLVGEVKTADLHRMIDGLNPADGAPLTQRMKDNRRIGYDFTVSLNKSASILRAFADPGDAAALDAARERALDGMMALAEADMHCRERRAGADHDVVTGNMAYAAFHHSTSRPVKGKPADMNEHTHLLVFNVTRSPDGRMLAGQFANLKRDGEFYSAVFDALYAKELEKLGFRIERQGGKKWKVAGIADGMIATFSKRRNEIEETAAALGIADAARKSALGATTRAGKDTELSPDELRQAWWDQLTSDDRAALARVYARGVRPGPAVSAREAVAFALDHLSEQRSAFAERELMATALMHGLGHVTPEQVAAEVARQGVIVDTIDGQRMATTEALQEEERYIARVAGRGLGGVCPVGAPDGLTRQLGGKTLNDGQWNAAIGLLDSPNRVNLVEGPAGAGKSSLLGKFDEGARRRGQTVTYLASSTDAAGLLVKDGFAARTVAHFLRDERMQKAAGGGRVVVDETSLLGHKDAVRLLKLAEKDDLKLIFVGDPMQHGSVPRGAFLRVLKDHGGIRPFRLTEILRQETPEYRDAAKLLSEGQALEGWNALDAMGWVRETGDDAARVSAIADDYMRAMTDGASCLVVSPTHAEAASCTAAIRDRLRDAGQLGADERAFTRLVATNASEAERRHAFTYRPGDVIQFHQNAQGFTKGDRLTVTDPASVPVALAEHFSVYRPESIKLAAGDKLRFTGTVKTLDGTTLKNGANHTVAGFTGNGGIRLAGGKVIAADAGHVRHGYVDTSFASQGKTVGRVLLAMSSRSLPAVNMEQLYVSASRGKQSVTIHTDDKEAVAAAIGRSSQKLAALDLRHERREAVEEQRRRLDAERQRRLRLEMLSRRRAAVDPAAPRQRGMSYGR